MRKREVTQLLKANGFWMESATRHEVWTDGQARILISRGSKSADVRMAKFTRVLVKRALAKRNQSA